jgi:3-methyladenine DNA glycosylase AlkD
VTDKAREVAGTQSQSGTTEALARLQARLEEAASEKSRGWWERYLKGTAAFRGVPMPVIRRAVTEWSSDEGLDGLSPGDQKKLAFELLGQRFSEDKLAGVLLLGEHLLPALGARDLPSVARAFGAGHISDWNLCDWFSVKVLAALIERDGRPMAEAIAAWRESEPLWQRRAAAVALAPLAPRGGDNFEGFVELAIDVADANAGDDERFMQTSVGWLLRELSKRAPQTVRDFVREHEDLLSSEARRMALAKIGGRGRR